MPKRGQIWPAWARWALTAAFFAGVNWMMLAPSSAFRKVHVFLAHQDKIAHAGIFLGLALLVRWSVAASHVPLSERGKKGVCLPWFVFTVLVCYAATIELCQPLLKANGRRFEWLDMASNFAGVVAGWLVYRVAGGGSRPPGPVGVPGDGGEGAAPGLEGIREGAA